jgi:magnesium and cobalt exporter, CNNM family
LSLLDLLLLILFLLGGLFLKTTSSCLQLLQRRRSREQVHAVEPLAFYRRYQALFFRSNQFEALVFCIAAVKHFTRFAYGVVTVFFILSLLGPGGYLSEVRFPFENDSPIFWGVMIGFGLVLLSLIASDLVPRVWAHRNADRALRAVASGTTLFLLIASPLTYPLLALTRRAFAADLTLPPEPVAHVTEKIMEMIQEAGALTKSEQDEKRLLEAAVKMRDRIVREVMVPRIDLFALPAATPIGEAAGLLIEEGYSRIPIYRDSIDTMVGLLLYKDVLKVYRDCADKGITQPLEMPIETLAKPLLFTPENSRLSHLLREFRDKQTHLAVVVDEYGGTEGVVTIEDCLEQIVGEIGDEFDLEEEEEFERMPDGSWIVDGRMGLLSIEEKCSIQIPHEADYDSIGGYLFHCAGEIPSKGFRVQHDDFDLEVVLSDDRRVERVRITPHTREEED